MRRFLISISLGLGVVLLGAAGQPPQTNLRTVYNHDDYAALGRVSAYLNGIKTLQSSFLQLDPSGQVEQGELYISRPGRMRFEYNPPSALLIVSDGRKVAVQNKRLNTVDTYSLSDTPLSLILADNIDLARNPAVVKIVRQSGTLLVYARSVNTKAQGNIVFVFADPVLELRQWSYTDNQGQTITTTLRDTMPGKVIDAAKFVLPVKTPAPQKAR